MAGDGDTPGAPGAPVAQRRRSWRQTWQAHPARRSGLTALLCVLVSVLLLTPSACDSPVVPPDRTPTPTLSRACVCWCYNANGGAVPQQPPFFALAASPPVIADGVVYVAYTIPDATHNPLQDTYAVAALRARDGLPLWRVPTARFTEPIAVADGVLIVSEGGTRKLVGLRASDGATLWHSAQSASIVASSEGFHFDVAPSGGVLYAFDYGVDVYALRFADGRTLWQTPMSALGDQRDLLSTPPVADGTSVYVGTGKGSIVALQADTGAVRWTAFKSSTASPKVWHYPLATYGGQLYVTAYNAQSVNPAVLRVNAVDGTDDGFALHLPMYAEALYPALTADIFTTVISPSDPLGGASASLHTINSYRLSATGDGHLLWSVPGQAGTLQSTAHDAQTFYFEALPPGVIAAYRLTDGAVLWREPALASSGTRSIVAGSGYLFETMAGMDAPCHTPPTHQAPQIRALTATHGAVAWTRTLDAML